MSGVTLKNVKKHFGAVEVIKGVDIDIQAGEFCVFVGPSGCGKSTLLRMIAGLEDISGGSVSIGERRVNDLDPKDRGTAMVFQTYALYPHMTVERNMGFGLRMNGMPKDEVAERVAQAARILQLEDYLKRKPKALSGGQRQRVAIGRAIVRDPQVFLFDEPLSNLDAELRMQMRVEINKLHRRLAATMIFVTHDQVEAMTLATRIVVLANKGIAQVGTPLELYERPENEFVAQFIGSPAMNLLSGEIVETGARTTVRLHSGGVAVSAVPTQSADKGLKVNVGVRPEDLVATTGDCIFEGTVNFTEALGEVTILYFNKLGDNDAVIGKLPGIHADLRGKSVRMTADPAKVQIFNNGRSLYYR